MQKQGQLIEFYDKEYDAGHWAHYISTPKDENFIAELLIYGVRIILKVNPTDARGYRTLAVLTDEKMSTTYNREYTIEEHLALSTAMTMLVLAYKEHGIVAQIYVAGNNSQSITANGKIQLGNDKEPSRLHGHVIGRGNPHLAYIADVPLRGPKAGLEFNMRGDGAEEGNNFKVPWMESKMEAVGAALSHSIWRVWNSSPIFHSLVSVTKVHKSI